MTITLLGAMFAVSSSRIRYVQARAEARIRTAFGNELQCIARALTEELGPDTDVSTVNRKIDDISPKGVGRTAELVTELFRQALIEEMGCRQLRASLAG